MKARVLLRIAWLSVLLGVVMETLLLTAALLLGAQPAARAVVADLVQKVAWSTIVCLGLGIGTSAAKTLPPMAGLCGLVAGPVGFIVARSLHQGVAHALEIALGATTHPSAAVLAILKGVQYGGLGQGLTWAGKRFGGSAAAHVGTGLTAGVVFGGATLALMAPLPTTALVVRGLNEVLFPVGCSLVVYAASAQQRVPEGADTARAPEQLARGHDLGLHRGRVGKVAVRLAIPVPGVLEIPFERVDDAVEPRRFGRSVVLDDRVGLLPRSALQAFARVDQSLVRPCRCRVSHFVSSMAGA